MNTFDVILVVLSRTPLWVWPLIATVLGFGVWNLWTREIAVRRLVAFPLIMLGLSLSNAIGTAAPPTLAAGMWLAAAAFGAAAGWAMTGPPLALDPARRRITIAGSALPLLVTIAIILLRYGFGYAYGRYPELRADPMLALELIGAAAFLAGITFGRYGYLGLRAMRAWKVSAA
jgi:hypothetical protein